MSTVRVTLYLERNCGQSASVRVRMSVTNINEARQEQIFNEFYGLGSHDQQFDFLFIMIKVVDKARSYVGQEHSRREKTRLYYLLNSNVSETRVCKRFFQNTLAVYAGESIGAQE